MRSLHTSPFVLVLAITIAASACSSGESESLGEVERTRAVAEPIIGGSEATAFPEAALIDMSRNGRIVAACSGSIIAPQVVLTAGHCVDTFTGWRITAPYAGKQTVSSTSGTTFDWHENGAETVNPNHHDIGLVFLPKPIALPSYPAIATAPVASGSKIINLGRINNGVLSTAALFASKPIAVKLATSSGFPFDYVATEVIESGDSGGPDEVPGTSPHLIVAVNSGGGGGSEVLARTDLLATWIQQQIAAHGGGGGSTGTGADAGAAPTPTTTPPPATPPDSGCTAGSETEPNDTYRQPNALGTGSLCGALGTTTDQDWYTFDVSAAGVAYDVKLTTTGDAQIAMWKLVGGSYAQVANTSATEIAHASSSAGHYLVGVASSSGQTQSYHLTTGL